MPLRLIFLSALAFITASLHAAPLVNQAGNLLENGSFENGTFTAQTGHNIQSAADNWRQWSNSGAALTSQLISGTDMQGIYGTDVVDGDAALKFSTGGAGDGGFTFDFNHNPGWDPLQELTISAWVFVITGKMGLFMGANVPGNFTYTETLATGQWEYLELTRAGGQLNNEPLLYSLNGPAEFIVDAIWLNYGSNSNNPSLAVPAPLGVLLMLLALPMVFRRKRATCQY